MKSWSSHLNRRVVLRFPPPLYAYDSTSDSCRTFGLLTPLCLPFAPILLDGRHLLCTITYSAMTRLLCTCIDPLCRCLTPLPVYKRSTLRLRNSKRVLFCTNTSRRRTCPSFLVNHDPRANTLPRISLSPERLSHSRDLVIRMTTTRNIRTRFTNHRTNWKPT